MFILSFYHSLINADFFHEYINRIIDMYLLHFIMGCRLKYTKIYFIYPLSTNNYFPQLTKAAFATCVVFTSFLIFTLCEGENIPQDVDANLKYDVSTVL